MFEPSKTDHNCKSDRKKKQNRRKGSIPKLLFRLASMAYGLYRLISKVLQAAEEFLA